MSDHTSLKALAARIAGLSQAMEAVMRGNTPDHAKWTGTNSFVRSYCDLASQYIALTGDRKINIYDTGSLKSWADTLWPQQKGFFDTIYADTLILNNLVSQIEIAPTGPLYNLLVSGLETEWLG